MATSSLLPIVKAFTNVLVGALQLMVEFIFPGEPWPVRSKNASDRVLHGDESGDFAAAQGALPDDGLVCRPGPAGQTQGAGELRQAASVGKVEESEDGDRRLRLIAILYVNSE